jgi:hypothetical protein
VDRTCEIEIDSGDIPEEYFSKICEVIKNYK